ncbi:S-layer homology domain-containing protein [Kamptonema formosum]|uniref:S-layer homology domain-containing protein n=1 Tax=Kamptonema formosum TaxID=331992 RepID=UPI00034A5625|nr:S-layer homology domain-containing protein [Oscillatoria sp. PCC 10802]
MDKWQIGSAFLAAVGMAASTALPWAIQTPAAARTAFYDVQGHWAQLCVEELADRGVFLGFGDGSFRPNASVTWGEFATIVSKAFRKAPAASSETPPADASAQSPEVRAFNTARETGFLAGFPGGVFQPAAPVTRAQALVSLANGLNFTPKNFAASDLNLVYDDAASIPPETANGIAGATEKGLAVNYPNLRLLNPNREATRAEVASFICQALASSGKASPVPPQYAVTTPNTAGVQSEIQTSPSGLVRAQLFYERENFVYTNPRLQVKRGDEILLDTPLPVGAGISANLGFRLQDLDGDREPEILVDFFPRARGCCSYSLIYRYVPSSRQYSYMQQPWGYAGYKLKDFDLDGIPEFESSDRRFGVQFAASAPEVPSPLQILQYRQGQMFDVTRQYPSLVAASASQLWQDYENRRSQNQDVRAVLAAYLAEKHLLGEGREGWSQVLDSYDGSDRTQYLDYLRNFLRTTGYYR